MDDNSNFIFYSGKYTTVNQHVYQKSKKICPGVLVESFYPTWGSWLDIGVHLRFLRKLMQKYFCYDIYNIYQTHEIYTRRFVFNIVISQKKVYYKGKYVQGN